MEGSGKVIKDGEEWEGRVEDNEVLKSIPTHL